MIGRTSDHGGGSENRRLRSWRLPIFAVLSAAVVCLLAGLVIRLLRTPPYAELVDELPASARLDRYESVRHGSDHCHVFEFRCSDSTLLDTLVGRWRLRDLTDSGEEPVSFMEYEHPDWWTPNAPSAARRFGRSDDKSETYISVWEQRQTGRLYVETGRW